MIRIACPGCGSILNAKDELAGQTRKCPKCGRPVTIPAVSNGNGASIDVATAEPPAASLKPAHSVATSTAAWPERLERRNRYLICDKSRVLAQWENNGQGWMLRTKGGTVNAGRHRDQIPNQGDFRLVELQLDSTEAGYRLAGIGVYRLAPFGALLNLCRGDDAILASVIEPSSLNKPQKYAVWESLRQQLIPEIWERSTEALKYLSQDA